MPLSTPASQTRRRDEQARRAQARREVVSPGGAPVPLAAAASGVPLYLGAGLGQDPAVPLASGAEAAAERPGGSADAPPGQRLQGPSDARPPARLDASLDQRTAPGADPRPDPTRASARRGTATTEATEAVAPGRPPATREAVPPMPSGVTPVGEPLRPVGLAADAPATVSPGPAGGAAAGPVGGSGDGTGDGSGSGPVAGLSAEAAPAGPGEAPALDGGALSAVPGGADAVGGPAPEPGVEGGFDDTVLIDEELAEHERWAGSFGDLGTAGSDDRARFLLDQAGQGASAGFWGGVGMGAVMGAAGGALGQIAGRRLATLAVSRGATAVPVPGLGPAIGGVMAVAGLAMRDWGATGQTIGRIGTGEGYEGLANDLEGLAEVLDVACSIMDVVGGVLGGIAVGMWVGAVLSAGTLSPLAATLSAIATGIGLATTAVGIIINVVVRPAVTALRALHAFESQGDPAQIEAEGAQLQAAAAQVTGAAGGALGGRVGGAVGTRGGTRLDRAATRLAARRTGGRPAMSATAGPGPRLHLEMPDAPGAGPRAVAADAAPVAAARPASGDGPAAAAPRRDARAPDDFSDLNDVVADLNSSPALAARLTDNRPALPRRATPWTRANARAYANRQAAAHRTNTGMTGGDVQAGHTAAARNAVESGIREIDWDTQPMMDLNSRRGQGLDVTTVDPRTGETRTRTRHTAQERLIDSAIERSRAATGGRLTPRGHLDSADYVAWVTQNTPWRQGDVDALRTGPRAAPGRGPAVDPATGLVIPPATPAAPRASSPAGRSPTADGGSPATPRYAPHTETVRTPDRAAAMAQYHAQVRADPGRESGVWQGADGTFYVMQGDSGSVAPPSAAGPLRLVYHSHPTEADAAYRGLVSQPSQAAGDLGVLQYQHGQGVPGRRQDSELHFPVYDANGNPSGYGATRFAYDPTSPLPLQVTTTLPGGRPATQRYASFADFEARTGIRAGGDTPAASSAARVDADAQLQIDVAAASQRIDATAQGLAGRASPVGAREGRDAARTEPGGTEGPAPGGGRGPAYTASVAGLAPGEALELPINPAYPAPPGSPAQLDALLDQVDTARAAQADLGATERRMSAQAGEQRTQDGQLGEALTVTEDLAAGRSAHQGAVDSTSGANDGMLDQAGEAYTALGNTGREAGALATLVGSLEAFGGMAHLFSYLPGNLGRQAAQARADTQRLVGALNRVRETDGVQASVAQGQGGIEADAARIESVSTDGAATDETLVSGQTQVTELQAANAQCLAETEATGQQAATEGAAAAGSEAEAQAAHDGLLADLQVWAQRHAQAREDTVATAMAGYQAMGLEVRQV